MIKLCALASGSSGNAIFIQAGGANLLIDCGVSGSAAEAALQSVGHSAAELDAVLITHEHIDHIKGAGVISRRYDVPVYANRETWLAIGNQMGSVRHGNIKEIKSGRAFSVKDAEITAFNTPHDAARSLGFRVESGGRAAAVATDIGCLTQEVFDGIKGVDLLLFEANHDVDMLLRNPSYPPSLKRRITGNRGHLSNADCARACVWLLESGVKNILLGHLSRENNTPSAAFETVAASLSAAGARIGRDIFVNVAQKQCAGEILWA